MFDIEARLRGTDEWHPAIGIAVNLPRLNDAIALLDELYGPDYELRLKPELDADGSLEAYRR